MKPITSDPDDLSRAEHAADVEQLREAYMAKKKTLADIELPGYLLSSSVAVFTLTVLLLVNYPFFVACAVIFIAFSFFRYCRAIRRCIIAKERFERLNSAFVANRIDIASKAIDKARADPMMPVDDDILDKAARAMTKKSSTTP